MKGTASHLLEFLEDSGLSEILEDTYTLDKSSTWNKMAILKNLFRLYQIDEDDLQFGLKPIKQ